MHGNGRMGFATPTGSGQAPAQKAPRGERASKNEIETITPRRRGREVDAEGQARSGLGESRNRGAPHPGVLQKEAGFA